MDFLILVTLRRQATPEEAEQLLKRFLESHPGSCPAVAEDLSAQTIDVTFLVASPTIDEAFVQGRRVVETSLEREREPHELLGISLEAAGDFQPS